MTDKLEKVPFYRQALNRIYSYDYLIVAVMTSIIYLIYGKEVITLFEVIIVWFVCEILHFIVNNKMSLECKVSDDKTTDDKG